MLSVYGDVKSDCCGCAACADKCPAGAITMRADDEGFLYPVITQSACTDCGVCAAICPLRRAGHYKEPQAPRFFVMKHRSEDVLRRSTSGGAFTALSDVILLAGGAVYGADFDDALRVLHRRAENTQQRDRMRFSKYVQSTQKGLYPLIRADLEAGRTVLYTGTPCQTAGMRARFPAAPRRGRLLLCDLICHSIPSPRVWEDYKRLLEQESGKRLLGAQFRSKRHSWGRGNSNRGFQYRLEGEELAREDSRFYEYFTRRNTIVRPSCYHCRFTDVHRSADLTIADYFGIEEYAPEWYSPLGVSLVLAGTPAGQELLQQAAPDMLLEERPAKEALAHQKRLSQPGAEPPERAAFWAYYNAHGLGAAFRHFSQN